MKRSKSFWNSCYAPCATYIGPFTPKQWASSYEICIYLAGTMCHLYKRMGRMQCWMQQCLTISWSPLCVSSLTCYHKKIENNVMDNILKSWISFQVETFLEVIGFIYPQRSSMFHNSQFQLRGRWRPFCAMENTFVLNVEKTDFMVFHPYQTDIRDLIPERLRRDPHG